MAAVDLEHEDYSKRERIFNALAVYPERYGMSNQVIADITDASTSYIYQLRMAIEEGEISDEEFESALDEELQAQYRGRIGDLLEESGVPRSIDEDEDEDVPDEPQAKEATVEGTTAETKPAARGADETKGGRENEVVLVEEVVRVRDAMERYREDAEFERERFEGSGKNVAEEKYFVSNRAVELLDRLIE